MTLADLLAKLPLRAVRTRGLSRNVVAAAIQNLVAALGVLIAYWLLIAAQGVEAVGLWSLTVGVVAFARLGDVSGGASLSRFVAVAEARRDGGEAEAGRGGLRSADYIDSVLLFTVALYVGLGLLGWYPLARLIQGIAGAGAPEGHGVLVALTVLSLILSVAGASQLSALDGLQRADLRAVVAMAGTVLQLLAAVALIPTWGLYGLAWAQILQQVLTLVAARALLVRRVEGLGPLPLRLSWAALRETTGFGLRLQAIAVTSLIFDPLSRALIGWSGGLAVLGTYELASRIVANVRMLVSSAVGPLVPAFAALSGGGSDPQATGALLRRFQRINVLASGALLSGVILLALPLSVLLLGHLDRDFLILMLAFAFANFVQTLAMPAQSLGQGRGVLRWNILGNVVMAVCAVGSVPLMASLVDPDHAGLGVPAALALGSAVALWGNARHFGLPAADLLPARRLAGSLGAMAALSILVAGLDLWLEPAAAAR